MAKLFQFTNNIDYNDIDNKPKINNVTVEGNKSLADYGIQPAGNYAHLNANGKVPLEEIDDSLLGNLQFQGLWDAKTNSPELPLNPTINGQYWIVSESGDRFGTDFNVGDWIVATNGVWRKVDNTDVVISVNGKIGKVVLTSEDITHNDTTVSKAIDNEIIRAKESELLITSSLNNEIARAEAKEEEIKNVLVDHIKDNNNPHNVTKEQIGLGEVDNTSDINKPISNAVQLALNLKADKTEVYTKEESDEKFLTEHQDISGKQDVIKDLDSIRKGAKLGETALQSFTETDPTVPEYVKSITQEDITNWNNKSEFSGNYNDLTDKPIIPEVPTKISELVNDTGFITSDYHDATKQDKLTAGKNITIENNVISASGSGGSGEVYTAGDGLTLSQDNVFSVNETIARTSNVNELLSAKQDVINDLDVIRSGASLGTTALQSFTETDPTVPSHVKSITQEDITNWNNKSDFSGNYNDLTNKPTIPEEITETKVSEWGFTKNTGTITSVKMNGKIVSSMGEADLGTVITEHQDITGKADKATTLEGYGITDAYTKTEVNNLIPSLDGLATEEYVNNYHDATKQDKLTAGKDITIENNVISNSYSFDDTEILADISDLQSDVQNLQTEIVKKANTTEVSNALATKQDTLIFDSVPTLNSEHPVYSNGIKESIDTKQDKSTAVNYNNITNCITEIPQDIKLELNNGTLTLKTGSKVYIPNGFESDGITKKFDVKNIKSNVTLSPTENGTFLYGVHPNGTLARYSNSFSGDTQPTSQYLCAWYDTTNNKVKRYLNNPSIWEEGFSFPIAIVTISDNSAVSIDQIFNGFGYIGSTVFALPGVKGLVPNGRNVDGSLKNIEATLTSVQTTTVNSNKADFSVRIGNNYIAVGVFPYDEEKNFNYNVNISPSNIREQFNAGTVEYSLGKVISLTPKTAFHAVDYSNYSRELDNKVNKTGNEIIAGVKTFQDDITAPNQIDYTNITNCITEIPQDIKLELNNGTLTLKAGSKVYIPNGPGVFNVINVSSDIKLAKNSSGLYFVFMKSNGVSSDTMPINYCYSSKSQPTITHTYAIWYDTANNKIKWTNNNGSTWVDGYSLPMCIVVNDTPGTQNVSSIDQVFNGFGYISSTIFALPGVKGLIPNGRNTDGSLKNIEFTVSNVISETRQDYGTNERVLKLGANYISGMIKTNYRYDETNNFNYEINNLRNYAILGKLVTTNNKIDSFTMPTAFHAADYQDVIFKQDITTAVNYDNISNCITEIPQDIKLELNNGTITLKTGSKVYVPNGDGKFDVVTVQNDSKIEDKSFNSGTLVIFSSRIGASIRAVYKDFCTSGTTAPTDSNYRAWYDTTNNLVKSYSNGAYIDNMSFPLAICSYVNGTGFTSIDQVFNGFGYISSTIFALPGVKGLIPNGRNTDGSLKSIKFTLSKVTTKTFSYTGNVEFFINSNLDIIDSSIGYRHYNEERNLYIRNDTSNPLLLFGVGTEASGKITSFTPKTTFHALDYNDKSTISSWSMPSSRYINLSLAASGSTYTAPANGYFYLGKSHSSAGGIIDMQNITSKIRLQTSNVVANDYMLLYLPARKNDIIRINYKANGTLNGFMFIFAEGEN